MIKLCAFDIAGTTVNDHHLVYEALKDCLTNNDIEVEDNNLSKAMGQRKDHAIKMLLEAAGADHSGETVAQYYERFQELLDTYYTQKPPIAIEGALEAITAIRQSGIKVALTTGFSQEVAQMVLGRVGWTVGPEISHTVDALVTSDQVPLGRPAPYLIYRSMERTGITNISHVLTAGDTVADLQAGTNAGAGVVTAVLTGPTPKAKLLQHKHCHILDSVAEIPDLLENLNTATSSDTVIDTAGGS